MAMVEQKLKEMGIELRSLEVPVANYLHAKVFGNLIYCSGAAPVKDGKHLYNGKLGREITVEQGYDAARPQALRLRFVRPDKLRQAGAFDDLGPTACGGVEELLRENAAQHPRLLPLWAELCAETSGR